MGNYSGLGAWNRVSGDVVFIEWMNGLVGFFLSFEVEVIYGVVVVYKKIFFDY